MGAERAWSGECVEFEKNNENKTEKNKNKNLDLMYNNNYNYPTDNKEKKTFKRQPAVPDASLPVGSKAG